MTTLNQQSDPAEVVAYQDDQQPVKLVYDTWICRPHFIVIQCNPRPDVHPDELQATYEIIGHFLQQKPQFATEAILSFRRGKWNLPQIGKWQARLYVSKELYIEQAKIAIKPWNIPRCNKEWRNCLNIENGINKWEADKRQEHNMFRDNCIRKGIPNKNFLGNIPLSSFNSHADKFEFVWTSPAPRIGIIARSPANTTLADLYNFMCQVHLDIETELSKHNNKFTDFNCHLCGYVRGQPGTVVTCRSGQILSEDERIMTNTNLVGYIQMDENQYLQWLPHNLKQIWLNAFGHADHFVGT